MRLLVGLMERCLLLLQSALLQQLQVLGQRRADARLLRQLLLQGEVVLRGGEVKTGNACGKCQVLGLEGILVPSYHYASIVRPS